MARAVPPVTDEWKSLLLEKRVQLVESIKFKGTMLWDHLLQNYVFTVHQYLDVEGKPDLDMSRYVLDHIICKPQFDGFVRALRDSGQSYVADLLTDQAVWSPGADDSFDPPSTKLKAVSLNGVTVTLVAPWCDKGILKKAGIQWEETWFGGHKQNDSSRADDLENMLRFILHMLRKFKGEPSQENVPFTLNHVVVGEQVSENLQEAILDFLVGRSMQIVYFACNMVRPKKLYRNIADKFSKLLKHSSVFTDAIYNEVNESINFPAHECIAVACERSSPDSGCPWGGLLDMVVPITRIQERNEQGGNCMITCGTYPAAYAVVTAIVIMINSKTLGFQDSDIRLLQSTRTMRRVLISLCDSDTQVHQPLTGFGTLKPESMIKDQRRLRQIITDHIDYRGIHERATNTAKKVNYTSLYTEKSKEKAIRQLMTLQGHIHQKVVVGILGSGLNLAHPVLAGRSLSLDSRSLRVDESDVTLDWDNATTYCTAALVNLLCTAGGDSLLDYVHFVHIKEQSSDGKMYFEDHSRALRLLLKHHVHVVIDPLAKLHPVSTWNGVNLLQNLKDRSVFITPAWFDMSGPYHSFPRTECLAVNGILSDGNLSRDPAAGPIVDFVAPVEHETPGYERRLPVSLTWNAASFTGAVSVYIMLLAKKHGLEEWLCRRLSSTDTMRQILLHMCETPDCRTAERGHGVLDPWSHLMDWAKLKPIIMKYTDESTPPSLWAGKDI